MLPQSKLAKVSFALLLPFFGILFLAKCNTEAPIVDGLMDLNLNDSLTLEAGKYDKLEIDILDSAGATRIPKAYQGTFSLGDSGVIKNIPLGENPPAKFTVQIRAYKNGILVNIFKIAVSNGVSSPLQTIPLPGAPLVSLAFDQTALNLKVGDTSISMQPRPTPSNASDLVILSVSDPVKASVLPGNKIHALAEGIVIVTATSAINTTIKTTLTLTMTRDSVLAPSPFDSVRISRSITKFYLHGAGQKISFTTYPIGKPAQLNWISQDAGVLKVDADGGVTAGNPGVIWVKAVSIADPKVYDSVVVSVVKDSPKLNAGATQSVALGQKVIFNILVEQEFGGIKSLQWDFEGDGKYDGSATETPAKAEFTYPSEKKEYLAIFKVVDGEGNQDSITVRVKVGFDTPLILITKPSRDTLVKSPDFTVAYTVDGVAKSKDFTLIEGKNRLVVTETKAAGTDSAFVFATLDSKAPVVTIISPTVGTVTNKSILKVDWKVDTTVQTQKNDEDISAKEGEIIITREATDEVGNKGQASVSIIRDITKPKVTFVKPKSGDTLLSSSVEVEWTVDGVAQTTQLTETLTGADGEKTLTRKATDAAGNTDSASIRVILNGSQPGAPKITLDVTSPTNSTTPTWSWISGGNGTGDYQYKLDNNDLSTGATATKALLYKAALLADGIHTLYVREKDAQGSWGPIGSLAVEVDTKAPVIVFTAPLAGAIIKSSPVAVTWTIDGVAQTTLLTEVLTGADGEKTITRTATDKAGNAGSASIKVILDATKPLTPIFVLPATPTSTTRGRKPVWTWKSAGGDGIGVFRYQLGTAAAVEGTATTYTQATDLADNTYTFKVAEKDAAGNWSSDAISTVTIKGLPAAPVVSIDAALSRTPSWTWKGTTGATFGYKLKDALTYIKEGTATEYKPTAAEQGDGLKTLCVAEKDAIGYGPEACQSIIIDRTDPVIALTSDVSAELMVTSKDPSFSGTASDANLDRVECKVGNATAVQATVTTGKWSCTPAQGDGDNTVTFTVFDKAGGKASASPVVVHKRSKVIFVRKNKTGDGTSWANAKGELSDVLKSGVTLPIDAEVWVGMGSYGKGEGYKFTSNTTIIGAFSTTGAPLKTDANPAVFVTSMDPTDMWIGSFEDPVSNFKIYGMVFDGSTALSRVYITKSTGITLESCKFTKFHADIPLLIRNESNVKIINSTFSNSYGVSEGMISVWTGSFVDIQNCEIKDNSATSGGGGLYILEASVQLTNCTFSGNTVEASDDNGEPISKPMNIYVSDAGNLSHTGLKLSGGSATVSGGGTITPPIP